jgi:hypothetical protein
MAPRRAFPALARALLFAALAGAGAFAGCGTVTFDPIVIGSTGSSRAGTTASSASTSTSGSNTTTSTSGGGGSGVPADCAEANRNVGCCDGNVDYYCRSGSTMLTKEICDDGNVCGWNAQEGYYDCVDAPGGADPSHTYPRDCP